METQNDYLWENVISYFLGNIILNYTHTHTHTHTHTANNYSRDMYYDNSFLSRKNHAQANENCDVLCTGIVRFLAS